MVDNPNKTVSEAKRPTLIPELRATLKQINLSTDPTRSVRPEQGSDIILQSETLTREFLSQIAVIAFVGQSGTGKSTRAIAVARQNNIEYLIDDGLLINGGRIVAGTSAKKAPSKMESVRQALFVDPTRQEVMRRAIVESAPKAIMILGTSDSMLEKITTNLWLIKPSMLIRIEDVSTEEERRHARSTRMNEGIHTIPVPTMEIKHEFSGYFSDPLDKIRSRLNLEEGGVALDGENERTMIRPTFSSLGSYSISDDALLDLIRITLSDLPGYGDILGFKSEKRTIGVVFNIDLALLYGFDAQKVLLDAQQKIGNTVEKLTAITVVSVNIRAERLIHGKENK